MTDISAMLKGLAAGHRDDWSVKGDTVDVRFGRTSRHQSVKVTVRKDMCVITSVILGKKAVTENRKRWDRLALTAWERNAEHELVTFAFDRYDRLVGQVRHPAAYLDPEELELYITTLARECDRFEYLLGGQDEF